MDQTLRTGNEEALDVTVLGHIVLWIKLLCQLCGTVNTDCEQGKTEEYHGLADSRFHQGLGVPHYESIHKDFVRLGVVVTAGLVRGR